VGRVLTCTHAGYPVPYAQLTTRAAGDIDNAVVEKRREQ